MLDWEGNMIDIRNRTQIMLYEIEVEAMTESPAKLSATK